MRFTFGQSLSDNSSVNSSHNQSQVHLVDRANKLSYVPDDVRWVTWSCKNSPEVEGGPVFVDHFRSKLSAHKIVDTLKPCVETGEINDGDLIRIVVDTVQI